jgi:glycosyltransferase involved in cell wall biosynthesis
MKKKLVIINNEKCVKSSQSYFCENIEISSLSYSLLKNFYLHLVLRKENIEPIHKIFVNNKKISFGFFSFIYFYIKNFNKKNTVFLIIAITPFTFFIYLFLIFQKSKIYLYLRSDGRKEFRYILGSGFTFIYKILLFIMSIKSKLISVNKEILNKKNKYLLVFPSQISKKWDIKLKTVKFKKKELRLLYVGRLKKEKGVYSLINIFNDLQFDFPNILTLCGTGDKISSDIRNVIVSSPVAKIKDIINLYDSHNITILPSFTEGHPQVLLESLSRRRPVIIFEDIKHVKKNYKGVFVTKRNTASLKYIILKILSDYNKIQNEMEKNKIPTHKEFIRDLTKVLVS